MGRIPCRGEACLAGSVDLLYQIDRKPCGLVYDGAGLRQAQAYSVDQNGTFELRLLLFRASQQGILDPRPPQIGLSEVSSLKIDVLQVFPLALAPGPP